MADNPFWITGGTLLSVRMPSRAHVTALILGVSFLSAVHAVADDGQDQFVVAGYLPHYRVTEVVPESLKPLTDLIYFGLTPPADGRLAGTPVDPAVLKKLHEIKRVTGCRLLLCVGGWNRSQGFVALGPREKLRKQLVAELLAFCRNNGFDGVDFDWEHPKGPAELAAYRALLADTRKSFGPPGLLVTVALASWQNLGKSAYTTVDRVHLMSYDHDYPQATLEKTRKDVDRLIGWGCPSGKIAMGLPFYGRNRARGAHSYRQLVGNRMPDPDRDEINGYAFNGPSTLARKIRHARQRKLAGVMIWEAGQDHPREEFSLLKVIGRQVGRGAR
ncbi:MAG: hypothetical protein CMN05_04110 [Roseibacillus sp.]|nr:hypothetical protein [Roseibacillus sp.]MBP35829.1 hypothetical protein [Roseibacillus sp.]